MWYLTLFTLIKNNRRLLIVGGIILLIVGLAWGLSNKYAKMSNQKEKDDATILSLQREIITLKRDTAHYRQVMFSLKADRDKLKKINKEANKDLSSEFPSIDKLKNK